MRGPTKVRTSDPPGFPWVEIHQDENWFHAHLLAAYLRTHGIPVVIADQRDQAYGGITGLLRLFVPIDESERARALLYRYQSMTSPAHHNRESIPPNSSPNSEDA